MELKVAYNRVVVDRAEVIAELVIAQIPPEPPIVHKLSIGQNVHRDVRKILFLT